MSSLFDQLKEKHTTEREQAAKTYKTLLLRHAQPKSGDVDQLREVMNVLGRSADDLPGDLAIAKCLVDHECARGRQEELQKARADARATLNTVGQEAERARQSLEKKLRLTLDKAGAAHVAAVGAVAANQQVLDQTADAVRYAWPAMIAGEAVEVYRERHRSRRKHALPDKSRAAVLAERAVELGGARITGSARHYVDHHLRAQALRPLTDEEWERLTVAINERRQTSGVKPLQHDFKHEALAPHGRNVPVAHGVL